MEKEQNGLLMLAQCLQYEGYDDNALKILDIVTAKTDVQILVQVDCFLASEQKDQGDDAGNQYGCSHK